MLKNSVNRIAPNIDLTHSAHFISLRKRRTLHFGIYNEHTGRITTVYTLELQVGDLFVLGPAHASAIATDLCARAGEGSRMRTVNMSMRAFHRKLAVDIEMCQNRLLRNRK